MGKVVHFEIHVDDMERAKKFYGEVFGWSFQDWSEYAGMPYVGAVTGDKERTWNRRRFDATARSSA